MKYHFSPKSICREVWGVLTLGTVDKPEIGQYSVTVALCIYNFLVNRFLLSLTMTLYFNKWSSRVLSDDMKYTHAAF